jgi:hypothetical protein
VKYLIVFVADDDNAKDKKEYIYSVAYVGKDPTDLFTSDIPVNNPAGPTSTKSSNRCSDTNHQSYEHSFAIRRRRLPATSKKRYIGTGKHRIEACSNKHAIRKNRMQRA